MFYQLNYSPLFKKLLLILFLWRREWDSNPRMIVFAITNGFQDRRLKPLDHPFIREAWDRTRICIKWICNPLPKPFQPHKLKSSMVERKGLEPLILPCKGNVLPVRLSPLIMAVEVGFEPTGEGFAFTNALAGHRLKPLDHPTFMVAPGGFEPPLPDYRSGVLTIELRGYIDNIFAITLILIVNMLN